jgi:hypothetical protein
MLYCVRCGKDLAGINIDIGGCPQCMQEAPEAVLAARSAPFTAKLVAPSDPWAPGTTTLSICFTIVGTLQFLGGIVLALYAWPGADTANDARASGEPLSAFMTSIYFLSGGVLFGATSWAISAGLVYLHQIRAGIYALLRK